MKEIGGIRYPSVTEVLAATGLGPAFDGAPTATLEYARMRGKAVHQAIQWSAEGVLDESSLHPEIEPGFRAYQRFRKEADYEPLLSEVEVVDPTWKYVGHIDQIGWWNPGSGPPRRALIDWKYTDALALLPASYQIAGYARAWAAAHPEAPVAQTLVVQLKRDGTYRIHQVDAKQHDQVFLAALIVFRARMEGGNP